MKLSIFACAITLVFSCVGVTAAPASALPQPAATRTAFPVKMVSAYYGESPQALGRGSSLQVTYTAPPGSSFCVVIGARKLDLGPRWAQQHEECVFVNELGRATVAVNVPYRFSPDSLLLLTVVTAKDEVHTDALKVAKFIR